MPTLSKEIPSFVDAKKHDMTHVVNKNTLRVNTAANMTEPCVKCSYCENEFTVLIF